MPEITTNTDRFRLVSERVSCVREGGHDKYIITLPRAEGATIAERFTAAVDKLRESK